MPVARPSPAAMPAMCVPCPSMSCEIRLLASICAAQIDANKKFNFYIGVDNLLDTKPPLGTTGAGFGSAIYDNVGRFFYAGVVAKF